MSRETARDCVCEKRETCTECAGEIEKRVIAILLYEGARERDLERDGHERRFKYLVACIKDVNIKGIQIFDLEMMIHVIHTRAKIDLSNMHIHLNLGTCMLFY